MLSTWINDPTLYWLECGLIDLFCSTWAISSCLNSWAAGGIQPANWSADNVPQLSI